jgi:hypothetical protein
VRRFPMHFVTDREYVIARRSFQGGTDGCVYGITKGLDVSATVLCAGGEVARVLVGVGAGTCMRASWGGGGDLHACYGD